ncbi:hypothetical protein CEQ90_01310 [Lewinellaceae bacterium SD302]|nr:hypothetical protein CEQ90_01310 [Lewinellaceae bacterium SD302]
MHTMYQNILLKSLLLLGLCLSVANLSSQNQNCIGLEVADVYCSSQGTWFATVEITESDIPECATWSSYQFGFDGDNPYGTYTVGPYFQQTGFFSVFCSQDTTCESFLQIVAPPAYPCPDNSCFMSYGGLSDTTHAVCNGPDGSVSFNMLGSGNYYIETYDSESNLVSTVTNNNTVGGLAGGEYMFLFFCEEGDQFAQDFASVFEVAPFTAGVDVETENCSNYTLSATPDDPANYTYQWSDGQTGSVINVSGGGVYQLTITDAEGCSSIGGTGFLPQASFEVNVNTFPATCDNADGSASGWIGNGNPQEQYFFEWPNGATEPFVSGLLAGSYVLTVTDAFGCSVEEPFIIESIDLPVFASELAFLCEGSTTLQVWTQDSFLNYTYVWTDEGGSVIGNEASVEVTATGDYMVVVTDEFGCSGSTEITVLEGVSLDGQNEISFVNFPDSIDNECYRTLSHQLIGSNQFLYSEWQIPGQNQTVFAWSLSIDEYGPGLYVATSVNFQGDSICPVTDSFYVQPEDFVCVDVSGLVYLNLDDDCSLQNTDLPLGSRMLRFNNLTTGDEYFGFTNPDGTYEVALPVGTYETDLMGSNDLLELCTPAGFTLVQGVPLTDENVSIIGTEDCPRVTVDVTVPMLRRCFNNGVYINYENTGTVVAEDVVVSVEVGDFASNVQSWFGTEPDDISTDPVTGITTATFVVGDLNPFEGGTFYLQVYTCSNDFPLGAAGCITAIATPNNPCPPADPEWSGASLRVNGSCNGNEVIFTVTNVGDAPTTSELSYVVIEDGVLLSPQPLTDTIVQPGDERTFAFPANGATYHFQVEQEPLHPGLEMPTDFVEACADGQQVSYGFALQFPLSDDAYWIDEECNELIGAYDPNDKRAMPRGYSDERFIEAGQMLDYTIRFQNTGTDTAFTVIIRDTLSDVYELSTLEITGTTHSVRPVVDSTGHNLAFVFENILLVDSFTNEPASHGAVSFRIQAREDLEPGTDVDNNASIYFDFNEAVVTNTYHLRVAEDFVSVSAFDFSPEVTDLRVFPNPTAGLATIQLPEALKGQTLQMEVYDMLGRRQVNYRYRNGDTPQADLSQLPAGWYNLRLINSNGQVLGNGRVLLQ